MSTNYPNQNDGRQGGMDMNDPMGSPSQDEFVFAEPKQPVNRNFLALVMIAAIGGGLIYFMYMRGGAPSAAVDPQVAQAGQTIESFMKDGKANIDRLEKMIGDTERVVSVFKEPNAKGQIPGDLLKTNPFALEQPKSAVISVDPKSVRNPAADALEAVEQAAGKAGVKSILYSAGGISTCVINNKLCQTGQQIEIDGVVFTVKRIDAATVELSHPLKSFTLSMQNKGDLSR